MKRILIVPALLLLVSACGGQPAPPETETSDPPPSAAQPPMDQPVEDVPPATAPGTASPQAPGQQGASSGTSPGVPATGTPDGDADMARFDGYGDIRFGTAAADMAQAWGGDLATLGKEANERCYFMTPTWVKVPAEFNFMIGDGRFARFGTESDRFAAPGGGKVGMTRAEIERLYAGRIEVQPHKYTDGEYLRIADPAGGEGVLVFETEAKGDDARVTEWRVGVPPQVDYVEGCA